MKPYKKQIVVAILATFGSISSINAQHAHDAKMDDFTTKQIQSDVSKQLVPNRVALRVKGLICESCGLGIRRKLVREKTVNTKADNKGINMDIKRMLLYIDLKEGVEPDFSRYIKAVKAAGYEPVRTYQKVGKSLQVGEVKQG